MILGQGKPESRIRRSRIRVLRCPKCRTLVKESDLSEEPVRYDVYHPFIAIVDEDGSIVSRARDTDIDDPTVDTREINCFKEVSRNICGTCVNELTGRLLSWSNSDDATELFKEWYKRVPRGR